MLTRRDFLAVSGIAGRGLVSRRLISLARPQFNTSNPAAHRLEEAIVAMPFDDCHCHPISDLDIKETTTTTPEEFLLGVTLPGFGAEGYFPHGVFEQWVGGDAQVKAQLRKKYNMQFGSEISVSRRLA